MASQTHCKINPARPSEKLAKKVGLEFLSLLLGIFPIPGNFPWPFFAYSVIFEQIPLKPD